MKINSDREYRIQNIDEVIRAILIESSGRGNSSLIRRPAVDGR